MEDTFPTDWTIWREQWKEWRNAHRADLLPTAYRFGPKNFLADDVLGVWNVNTRNVELSEVTFPDLSGDRHGEIKRYVGITFGTGAHPHEDGGLVDTFTDLERVLGIAS